MTPGSLWNYYRDKINDINDNPWDGKSLKYKTKIARKTPDKPGNTEDANQPPKPGVPTLNAEITIPLKYLRNRIWFIMDKRLCIDRTS